MNSQEDILKILKQADYYYYNTGTPIMSDVEYDALKLNLKDDYIGAPPIDVKKKHKYKLYSLDKVHTIEDIKFFMARTKDSAYVVMEKFDGLTIDTEYCKGNLVSINTRGDGEYGDNITEQGKTIKTLPKTISPDTLNVFGEALFLRSELDKLNSIENNDFKNCRNAAAGTLRLKNLNEIAKRNLCTFSYGVNPQSLFSSYEAMLEYLKQNGFNVPKYFLCKNIKEIEDAINYFKEQRDDANYDIDGIVISANSIYIREELGYTSKFPKWAIAFKFVADEKWTKLIRVIWQVGRTGRTSPVAEFEPIDLMGSTVSRATLHNEAYIKALGLDIDPFRKEICITKANDIIPAVINTRPDGMVHTCDLTYLFIPNKCPVCEGTLEKVNDQLFCTNPVCKEKLIAKAVHMVSREALDIAGLSEETIRKMYDALSEIEQIKDVTFAIGWTKGDFLKLEGFAEKSAEKLAAEMEKKCKQITFSKFLVACGVPLVGRTASKAIAKHFRNLDDLVEDIYDNQGKILLSIDGIGQELYLSLSGSYENEILPLLNQLHDYYDTGITCEYVEQQTKPDNQLTFVITGTLEKPRKYYQDLIENAGHKVAGSVSKKTNCVLVGEDAGSKLDKAMSLGIKIITSENELKELL